MRSITAMSAEPLPPSGSAIVDAENVRIVREERAECRPEHGGGGTCCGESCPHRRGYELLARAFEHGLGALGWGAARCWRLHCLGRAL